MKQIATTLDEYIYVPDDKVIEGAIEEGKRYREPQFNRTIEIESGSAIAQSCSWTKSTSVRRRWYSVPHRRMRFSCEIWSTR